MYHYDETGERRLLPAPLVDLPLEVEGIVQHVWLGNQFQMAVDEQAFCIVLKGVRHPETKEDHDDAWYQLHELIKNEEIRVVIDQRDHLKRCVGRVFVGDKDINLEMILSGHGHFDGTSFEGSESFAAAEEHARKQRLGMWDKLVDESE